MDIWVVAAAAGAGYVAQHWKNFVKGRQNLSDSSCCSPSFARSKGSPITKQVQDKNFPSDAMHTEKLCQEFCSEREPVSQDASIAEMASISRLYEENQVPLDGAANCSTYSKPNLLPGFLSNGDGQGDEEGVILCGDIDEMNMDLSLQPSEREMGVSYVFARKKSSLRSRRSNRQFVKPLSSLESCLMAQLYKEEAEMEEYTFSSICSPRTPVVRPFLLTDGRRIISRASTDSFSLPNRTLQNKPHMDTCLQEKTTIHGIPPLPSFGSMKVQTKTTTKTRMEQGVKLSHSFSLIKGKNQKFQGSSQGALLLGAGVSIGIMSSFLANKREVDKLTVLLKQSENFVQDLQEELEMKDSLTVKELAVEDYESQDSQNDTFNSGLVHAFSPEEKHDNYHKECHNQKADEESFSKIEAELEAELERLELNINSCRLERKLSNVLELDTGDMPDVVEGELKADLLGGQGGGCQPYADQDGSGSSTPHSVNYAVSPRELSLRLHEVIQSRLEQRIEELEIALQNSERKVRYMESERMSHWREFSNSEPGTPSVEGSPVAKQHSHADQPVVINLSGDALDAYNEAYDEFAKMNEFEEEEETPSRVEDSFKQEEPLQTFEQNTSWLHNGVLNGNSQQNSFTERRLMCFSPQQNGRDRITLSNDFITSGDHSDDDDDKMEELLIRHIVEKARKGSPAVLNAQKLLFSSDEK